jgi:glycosyltransferase involved in cell wall biosynthesis
LAGPTQGMDIAPPWVKNLAHHLAPWSHHPMSHDATDIARSTSASVDSHEGPELTVVVGSVEAGRSIDSCLSSVARACAGIDAEVLVVDASTDGSAERAERAGGALVVKRTPGTLVPDLWGEGICRSRGKWIALTTAHCTVPEGWAAGLLEALRSGAGGAGAGLLPNPGITATDRAVFFLRYGAFLELTVGEPRTVDDLPGDNAAYAGAALRSYLAARPGSGFWEIEYHMVVRGRGERLVAVPEATAGFGPGFPFSTILQHRFVHGRHHGEWRVRQDGEPRWRVLLPAPLVPFVLLGRAARRTRAHRDQRRALLMGAAPFLVLSAAWAAGEAVGAMAARRVSSPRSNGS